MIKNFSTKNIYKILATETRRTDLSSFQLAEIHKKLGRLLSYEILEEIDLGEIEIQHVQGIRKSISISNNEKFLILVLMRGGLYIAEGIKEILDNRYSMEFIFENNLTKILDKYKKSNFYNLIICDSVINTGKSIDNVLEITKNMKFKRTFITTLVLQAKAFDKYENQDDLTLLTARVSDNFYIGKGNTDTGNRLFNTDMKK